MARIAGVLALLVGSAVAFAPSPRFPTLRRQRGASVRVAMGMERTFIMVKPDGVERGLTGRIISRFEDRGLALEAAKFVKADPALLKEHYCHIADKPFFPALLDYMTSAPVFQMVWKGKGAVEAGRAILGETNPLASPAGDLGISFLKSSFCFLIFAQLVIARSSFSTVSLRNQALQIILDP